MRVGVPIQSIPPIPSYEGKPKPVQAAILNGYAQALRTDLASQWSGIWTTLAPMVIVAVASLFEPSANHKKQPPAAVEQHAPGPGVVAPPVIAPVAPAPAPQAAQKPEADKPAALAGKDWVEEWLPLIDSIKWVLFAALAALLTYRIVRFAITQNRSVDVKAKLEKLGDFSLAVGGPAVQGPG